MSQQLGVLGGTFDPIHHGHLVAAQEAQHQLKLDQILFVPAGTPPHKPTGPILPKHHRLHMVELAIKDQPYFAISRVDVDRPGPHYTVDMLRLLREEWGPDSTLFFIEGADSLADILTWHQPQRLIELCELAVVERPGVEMDLTQLAVKLPDLAARVHWVKMPLLEISSSDLRARVRAGRPISYLLPPAVEEYIMEHGLYRETHDQAPN
jgi:nicotinate-nucleotide adenylyltransferase